MQVMINRPWIRSFKFETAAYSETQLEQLYKLSRNFVASLDLGCPSAKHVSSSDTSSSNGVTEREKYLAWVKHWKIIYKEISQIIRMYKKFRRTTRFPKLTSSQEARFKSVNRECNEKPSDRLHTMAASHLPRLQETAMGLLNARYNAKLAAAEARRRSLVK